MRFLASLVLASASLAQPADLSELIAQVRSPTSVPAIGACVLKNGEIVAMGADGLRRAGSDARATTDDLWHLGSCTKAMTATLAATFVEDGTMAWETTLAEALPELADSMHESYRTATLRQLFTHRAGLPSDLRADGLWSRLWARQGSPAEQRWLLTSEVLSKPPVHAPGSAFLYANAGYAVAGAILERRAGVAWEDLMHERLFHPLAMTDVGFGPPGDDAADGPAPRIDQPRAHTAAGLPVEPGPIADNPPAIGPAGTVHASLESWSRFVAAHLSGERDPGAVLEPEDFVYLHTPAEGEDYALGWGVTTRAWARGEGGTGRVLTHSGSNTMWFCVAWLAPEKDLAILVVCNQGGDAAAKACDQVAGALVGVYAR